MTKILKSKAKISRVPDVEKKRKMAKVSFQPFAKRVEARPVLAGIKTYEQCIVGISRRINKEEYTRKKLRSMRNPDRLLLEKVIDNIQRLRIIRGEIRSLIQAL